MIHFYDPHCTINSISLPEEESKHAIKSLRLRIGEGFNVLNGKGLVLNCTTEEIKDNLLIYKVLSSNMATKKLPVLHVALSPLKQVDRFEYFVEKATELGISEITPLVCKRSEKTRVKADRISKILVSAMKQSGNPFRPLLNEPVLLEEFVNRVKEKNKFFGHCEPADKMNLRELKIDNDVVFLIGPEGDFTLEEIELCRKKDFIPVTFGELTLRAETAALSVCAYFQLQK